VFTYRALLRVDVVGALLRAAALARLAERMLALVLVLYVLARFQSAPLAGWVAFAAMAPGLAAGPLAGALLDRFGALWAIAFDLACSAGCILTLGLLALIRADSPMPLLVVAALYSLTSPFSAAGIRTLLPSVVPPAVLTQVNALDAGLYALVDVCGPAAAGALFGFAGAAPTLFTIGLLYAAAVLVLPRMPRAASWRWPGWGTILRDAGTGVARLLHHRVLRRLAGAYALYQVAWGILLVAVPVSVATSVGGGAPADTTTGLLWALAGGAGAVGALVAGRFLAPGREHLVMALGIAGTTLAIEAAGTWFGLPGLVLGLTLAGFLEGPVDVSLLTLRQRCTEPGWLGRITAVSMSFNLSGLPAGAALGGVLLAWSPAVAFAAAALACLAGAVASLRLAPGGAART
jgi:hypothetical protein